MNEKLTDEKCPGCDESLYREITIIRDSTGEVLREQVGDVTRCDGGCNLVNDWNGDVARAIPR